MDQNNLELVKPEKNEVENETPLLEGLLNTVGQVNPALGGFEEFAAILAMPDDKFNIVAPVILDELQKSFNNVDDKLMLIQAMNVTGVKLEDMQEAYRTIVDQIDEQLKEEIPSPAKRDFLKRVLGLTFNCIADAEGIAKKVINVPIELTSEKAIMPKYAHLGDGAVDLYCPEDVEILPGETKIIPVDIKVALPYGYAFLIHPRSGTSARSKLRIANSIGLIDSQYKGVIGVIVENIDPKIRDITYVFDENNKPVITSVVHGSPINIGRGERFAQMRLVEVPTVNFVKVDSVDGIGDDRGGGFGSTGVK